MLDKDLALLYNVPTKSLNLAVKRNKNRFPKDFMFRLTKKELNSLRFQNETSKQGGTRYLPYAFTEHGVAMLAGVLKSKKAVEVNIAIVKAFIALRKFALNCKDLAEQIKAIRQTVIGHDEQLKLIYTAIENLLHDKALQQAWKDRERIGFKK